MNSIQNNLNAHGWRAALYEVAMRSVNSVVVWKNLQCVVIKTVNPRYMSMPPNFSFVRLDRDALLSCSSKPEYRLSRRFVEAALSKGDECYAVIDGNILAGYGWYSSKPTAISDEPQIHFDPGYVYMYKGLTLPAYRGQRLHAIGMTRALSRYLADGRKGLVSYVETINQNSLKSCYRMGYQPCGRIDFAKIAGRYFIRSSRDCAAYGPSVEESSGLSLEAGSTATAGSRKAA